MPQRVRIELADVAARPNLEQALWRAARGKRARPDVAVLLADAESQLGRIAQALRQGRLPDGRLRAFAIRDPKPRIIHAAPFVDRVAHHALINLLAPRLEQALVPSSFACRPGLGVHRALLAAQQHMHGHVDGWVLKLDVAHCFPTIAHDRLLALLARRMKGSAFALVEHIVHAHCAAPGHGLPIGSLTSQHFANQFLGELDRAALAHPACLAHVRYMDDLLLWCRSRADALVLLQVMQDFAERQLGLALKPPLLQRCRVGVPFCGLHLGPRGLRLGTRRRRAWPRQWLLARARWQGGLDDDLAHQRRCDALRSLVWPAQPQRWQRGVLARHAATPSLDL